MEKAKKLKGPKGYPIVGVLPYLRANTFKFLNSVAKTYGNFVPMRILMTTSYLLNHPAHVEHVLQKNHRNYRKTPMAVKKLQPVLGEGLVTSENDLWARQRKLIQPSFNRHRVDALGARMVSVIDSHLDQWRQRAKDDQEFNLTEDTHFLTLEIALQTMFGTSLHGDFENFASAMKVIHETAAKKIWDVTGIGDRLPTQQNKAYREATAFLHNIVDRIISERRAKGTAGEDLLDILMDARDADTEETMTDKQLRDEVMTMMLSGHETTATMISWALLILSQHKQHLEMLRDEVDNVMAGKQPEASDLPQLDYMRRVIQEVARLRPSIWWFARVAINDDEIAGQPIKAGTTVFISQYLIHTLPSIWRNPDTFDPDRFLPENIAKRPKFAYFPFGAGPRVCVGSSFAMMEMQFTLAMIFRQFDVNITSDADPEIGSLITLKPRDDIRARVSPRVRH
jgi:cytochrome P450